MFPKGTRPQMYPWHFSIRMLYPHWVSSASKRAPFVWFERHAEFSELSGVDSWR